jgi:hypothetical protein
MRHGTRWKHAFQAAAIPIALARNSAMVATVIQQKGRLPAAS